MGFVVLGVAGLGRRDDGANPSLSSMVVRRGEEGKWGGSHLIYAQWALVSVDDVALAPRRW